MQRWPLLDGQRHTLDVKLLFKNRKRGHPEQLPVGINLCKYEGCNRSLGLTGFFLENGYNFFVVCLRATCQPKNDFPFIKRHTGTSKPRLIGVRTFNLGSGWMNHRRLKSKRNHRSKRNQHTSSVTRDATPFSACERGESSQSLNSENVANWKHPTCRIRNIPQLQLVQKKIDPA